MEDLKLVNQQLRAKRDAIFIDKYLSALEIVTPVSFDLKQHSYKFFYGKYGNITYYPKANKLLIHSKNKWIKPALKWILKNIIKDFEDQLLKKNKFLMMVQMDNPEELKQARISYPYMMKLSSSFGPDIDTGIYVKIEDVAKDKISLKLLGVKTEGKEAVQDTIKSMLENEIGAPAFGGLVHDRNKKGAVTHFQIKEIAVLPYNDLP